MIFLLAANARASLARRRYADSWPSFSSTASRGAPGTVSRSSSIREKSLIRIGLSVARPKPPSPHPSTPIKEVSSDRRSAALALRYVRFGTRSASRVTSARTALMEPW